MSKKIIVILAVGVVAASMLGVVVGVGFLKWQEERATQKKLAGLDRGEASDLRSGEFIPAIELVGLDGELTSTRQLCADRPALFVFVSIHCDPCTEVVATWHPYASGWPDSVALIGICQDDVEYAEVYVRKTEFPFPLYCDTARMFDTEFDMDVYPTLLGLYRGGEIAFIRHGFDQEFSPLDGLTLLRGGP